MKICTKCKAEKAIDDFAVDRSKSDGRKSRCKACDAAGKKKSYYAASPRARSSKVVLQRHRRWRAIAEEHDQRWLIEQVQALKGSGMLTYEAIAKADEDERLAAFFREAADTSAEALRTHLGSRKWDRVARPFVTKAERTARAEESRERMWAKLNALNDAEIVGVEWDLENDRYAPVYDLDEGPTLADFSRRNASDRILRKGRFATKRSKIEDA